MTTKAELLADPDSCLNRSADDEPVFLLCARDLFAPGAVEAWAGLSTGYRTAERVAQAREVGAAMLAWWRAANAPADPPPVDPI